MKKQALLFMAGSILALASCNNEPAGDAGMSQAQIDSAVNARVEEMRAEMMMQNDSLINALAQWKADSMIAAMKGGTAPASPRTTSNRPSPSKPAAKPTTPSTPAPNTPTGKNTGDKGEATGKNSQSQQTTGQPTGKRQN